jgi:hypothetical protein
MNPPRAESNAVLADKVEREFGKPENNQPENSLCAKSNRKNRIVSTNNIARFFHPNLRES